MGQKENRKEDNKQRETNKLITSAGEVLALLWLNMTLYERICIPVTVDVPGRITKFTFINICFVPKYFCSQTHPSFSVHKTK